MHFKPYPFPASDALPSSEARHSWSSSITVLRLSGTWPRYVAFSEACRPRRKRSLPHPTRVRMHQRLAFLAAEGFGKLRHVGYHVVYSVPGQRVRVADDQCAHDFRTLLGTPRIGVSEKEALELGESVWGLIVQTLALFF